MYVYALLLLHALRSIKCIMTQLFKEFQFLLYINPKTLTFLSIFMHSKLPSEQDTQLKMIGPYIQ